MLDSDDNMWVPEVNGGPGIGPGVFYYVYKAWIKFAYGKEIDPKDDKELKSIRDKYNKGIKEKYPKEYKSALNPV
jgi:hypothetical protein